MTRVFGDPAFADPAFGDPAFGDLVPFAADHRVREGDFMQVNAGGPPVVVGVDGSQRALGAVTWGAREAVRWNAPLFLIYAYDVPESGPRPRPSASDWIAARKQAADRLLRESMSVAERYDPGRTSPPSPLWTLRSRCC